LRKNKNFNPSLIQSKAIKQMFENSKRVNNQAIHNAQEMAKIPLPLVCVKSRTSLRRKTREPFFKKDERKKEKPLTPILYESKSRPGLTSRGRSRDIEDPQLKRGEKKINESLTPLPDKQALI